MAESNAGQLVTIGRFLEPVNAQMAKGLLDSAGIESFCRARTRTA